MNIIIILFITAVLLRLASLVKSVTNEKRLRKNNAIEYGKINSAVLVLLHTFYYISCITEAIVLNKAANSISYTGAGIVVFATIVLWMVIGSLKEFWTVKLIIAPQHQLNTSFIFKYIRHPNYFLNILPELVGLALLCQAWHTLLIGLPLYLIPLTIRIVQEERVMKMHFSNY